MSPLPPIPKIDDPELEHAVKALARSAEIYRAALSRVASGAPMEEVFLADELRLVIGECVIQQWLSTLQITEIDTIH